MNAEKRFNIQIFIMGKLDFIDENIDNYQRQATLQQDVANFTIWKFWNFKEKSIYEFIN